MNRVRLLAVIRKETRALLRDPRARILLIGPPVIQLLVFAFASTVAITHVTIGVLDLDGGRASRAVIEHVAASLLVAAIVPLRSEAAIGEAIRTQQVLAVLRFPPRFTPDAWQGKPSTLAIVYDGRRTNAAQLLDGYLRTIVADAGAEVAATPLPLPMSTPAMVVRHLYNPNLIQLWFVMPALVAVIAAVSILALVTQSVARERELGTFDLLRVSPLRTGEILVGKMVPSFVVGFLNVTLFVLLLPTVFGIPLVGSLPLFYVALVFYLLALTGLGMMVSCIAATQQQAFLGLFALGVPMVILSGYAGPIDNMPLALQWVSLCNPTAWFVTIAQGTFLKGMTAAMVATNTWPLAVFAAVTTTASAWLLHRRVG
jgi:ABC-2 type transport system permease protein